MNKGMLEYETKELLKYHIDEEAYYTLDYLNHQISGMELGYMESRNRPSTITLLTLRSGDHKLKQEGVYSYEECMYGCTCTHDSK